MTFVQAPRPALPARADSALFGILLMVGFCITAPLIDVAAKLAAASLPVGQISAGRFVVQWLLMLPVCWALGHNLRFPTALLGPLTLRALWLLVSTYCFIAAVRVMPIADALAIVFVEPFILLLLGKLIFGEDVGPRRVAASVVGFLGALLVIRPSFAAFGAVALFPLGTAVFFAFYMLSTRSLSRRLHPIPMQLHTSSVAAVLCLPFLLAGAQWDIPDLQLVMPQGWTWLWLGAVGLASAVSHLLMSYALRITPAATLAPLHYLEIVTAVVLGYLVFSDFPGVLSFAGMGIIVLSGLYIVHRERIAGRI